MPASGAEYALLQRKYKYENMLKRLSSHREAARERERSITWPRCATISKNSEGTCVTALKGCRRLLKRITSRTLPSSPPESTPPKRDSQCSEATTTIEKVF